MRAPKQRGSAANNGAVGGAFVWGLLPVLVVLAAWAAAAHVVGAPLGDLVREPTDLGQLAFYAGGLSAFGVGLWVGAGAVALAATVGRPWRDRRLGALLLVLGVLSLAIATDDQFRLHEDVLPWVGIPEELVYGAYASTVGMALWRARSTLARRSDGSVLVMALLLLGASVGVDVVQEPLQAAVGLSDDVRVYLEDGLKLCGAALWLRWVVLLSRDVHVQTRASDG